ncbi:MAG: hypothetical protein AAF236_12620 [Verrucomicrobiota bacterium]
MRGSHFKQQTAVIGALSLLTLFETPAQEASSQEATAEEGLVSLYLVEPTIGGGQNCTPYSPDLEVSEEAHLLALASAPAGSSVLMVAFNQGGTGLWENIEPVFAKQPDDGTPLRFPAGESEKQWEFQTGAEVEFFVVVYPPGDEGADNIGQSVGWLTTALEDQAEDEIALHTQALRSRLTDGLRRQEADAWRVDFGDSDLVRKPGAATAATTRSGVVRPQSTLPTLRIRRELDAIEEHWEKDSRPIAVQAPNPGLLVFPISSVAE